MAGRIHPAVVTLALDALRAGAPRHLPAPEALDALVAHDGGVPLEPYRAILDAVVEAGDGAALLEAGRGLPALAHPFVFVLLNSDTPVQVLDKLDRLNRFLHSRHRTHVVEREATSLWVAHRSIVEEPPHPGEHLVACSMHFALLHEIGCRGLRLGFGADGPEVLRAGERPAPLPPDGDYAQWRFEWDELEPSRRPMAGLDDVLLAGVDEHALREAPRVVQRVEEIVRRDLARSWRLEAVADALELAPRSLQRALRRAGTSWTTELDRLRVDEAARLLRAGELSVTEVGFACGFADNAHFARRFRKRFGRSPGAYRAQR